MKVSDHIKHLLEDNNQGIKVDLACGGNNRTDTPE